MNKEKVTNALRALKTDLQLLTDDYWVPEDPEDVLQCALDNVKLIAEECGIPVGDLELAVNIDSEEDDDEM